jgi:hypothetical protein
MEFSVSQILPAAAKQGDSCGIPGAKAASL